MSELSKQQSLKTFISGGIAGSVAKTIVAPIDRVKILFQVHNAHYEGVGVFKCFVRIVQQEGFLSLYKGNGAQILRIFPYAAIQFSSYEIFKHFNLKWFETHSFFRNLACGSLAGITAVTLTYPLDVIRSRLAFQYKGEEKYSGIFDAIKKIYAENRSLRSFYRGYSVTIAGMIPYGGLSFSTFENLKLLVLTERIPVLSTKTHHVTDEHHKYELTVVGKLCCGGLTGAIAQTVTYPLDVIRRHMQLENMIEDSQFKSQMTIKEIVAYVYNKYGMIKGFYRGISLNYLRAVPMVATSFCFYEISKKFLGLETGTLVKLS